MPSVIFEIYIFFDDTVYNQTIFEDVVLYPVQRATLQSSLNIYFTSIQKQVLTTYTNLSRFCFLGTIPVLVPNVWANENPKVDTRFRESNPEPYDCEADALPHNHGHHRYS